MSEVKEEAVEIPVEPKKSSSSLMHAMLLARAAMPAVPKSGENKYDKYTYSTMGDFLEAIRVPLELADLVLIAEEDGDPEYFRTPAEKTSCGVRLKVKTTITHVSTGESLSHISHGEAWDRGDKALYKALTGARKYGIQCLFNLYGDDDPEKDSVPENDTTNESWERHKANHQTGTLPLQGAPTPPATETTYCEQSDTIPRQAADSKAPAKQKRKPTTLEDFKGFIASKTTPEDLLDLVNRVAAGNTVPKDVPLFTQFVELCGKATSAKLQSGDWAEEQTVQLDQRVDSLHKTLTTKAKDGHQEEN